ncbi:MAG TPA: 50S ribosomal protein L11 methyltransferase [Solirubrobacteraceae bacterium]
MRVQRDQAELVLAELLDLAPAGVEEIQVDRGIVEYAVYGAPGELPCLPDLRAAVGDALVEVLTTEIPDDWHQRWKRFHRSVLIETPRTDANAPPDGRLGEASGLPLEDVRSHTMPALHVRPPWEPPRPFAQGDVHDIVIDPGQAFGTGGHASTRLCLELLLALAGHEPPAGPLLDVGTGSGVLAIAAAQLGFAPVLGLDNERESVEAAASNAAANGVEIEVRRWDLRAQAIPWLDSDRARSPSGRIVVVANLLRPLLHELAHTILSPPAHLLAGGLLREEVDEIARVFGAQLGLRERTRRESGEWAAVWLVAS